MNGDPEIAEGEVSGPVADEHPGLRISWIVEDGRVEKSPKAIKRRLGDLSARMSGAQAVTMRNQPVTHAYRVFYRHIGLDPDQHESRTPLEEAAMRRLLEGAYTSRDRINDALLIGIVETGIPVWALDEASLRGPLEVREAYPGEHLGIGPYADELPAGRLVVADDAGVVGVLFGEIAEERRPTQKTRSVRIFAIAVGGVPRLHVEEALWACAEALGAG